jgi:hypothetical protein
MPIPNYGQYYGANREAMLEALRGGQMPRPPAVVAGPVAQVPEYRRYPLGTPGPPASVRPGGVPAASPVAAPVAAAPVAAAAPVRNPNWNTDNYAAPLYTAARPSAVIPGFSREKWANPLHQTPKYVVGRIASQFAPKTENMDAVVAEIAKAYPGARRSGSGDVTIPGVGTFDILVGADVGGKRWHAGSPGGRGAKGGGGGGGGTGLWGGTADTSSNQLAEIMAAIQELAGSGKPVTNRDALIASLAGGI